MKRIFLFLIGGSILMSAAFAAAALLTINGTTNLQFGSQSLQCDPDVDVTFTFDTDPDIDATSEVATVVVLDIAGAACDGNTMTVTLYDGNDAPVASPAGQSILAATTSLTFDVAADEVTALELTRIDISILP